MSAEHPEQGFQPITDPDMLLSLTQAMRTLLYLMPTEHQALFTLTLVDRMRETEWQPWLKEELSRVWLREPDRDTETFPIAWVSREDLLHCCPEFAEQIQALDPSEIDHIGSKVGDRLQETYWMALEIVLSDYLQRPEPTEEG